MGTLGLFNAGCLLYTSMLVNSIIFYSKFAFWNDWLYVLILIPYVNSVIYLNSLVFNNTPLTKSIVIQSITVASINVLAGVIIFQEHLRNWFMFWVLLFILFIISFLYLEETSELEIRRDLRIPLTEETTP